MQDITSVLIATIAAISLIFCYTISTIRDVVKNTSYKGYTVFGNALFVIPFIYSLVFFFQSNEDSSCLVDKTSDGDQVINLSDAIYFSYVTWTTLGYGDIQPVGFCRILAASEAVVGYVFLALVVAYLIHLYRRD